ncbi:hypothetical protein [Mangrovibacterium lignilyticum]|uniref:hypothetical protein n=1 Tax=Mangrovibacterium lignilyticum TaxID=2668052 RepID=UPI0013D6E06A|nr:hypothetical protein [Mangrovibacterium lignilyticum]
MKQESKIKLVELALKIAVDMKVIIGQMKKYEEKDWLSPEDEERYRKLQDVLKDVLPVIAQLRDFFDQKAYCHATAYYYHVKEKAADGDLRAKVIYDDLRPLYEQALNEQIHKN